MTPHANKLLVIVLTVLTVVSGVMGAGPVPPPAPTPTPPPPAAAPVNAEQVAAAIAKAVASLRGQIGPLDNANANNYSVIGSQILSMLALVNAGVDPADPVIAKQLPVIANLDNQYVYVVSLKCQLLSVTDPKTYNKQLTQAAQWLMLAQLDNGMWTYTGGRNSGGGDNSNTQFALLGLHEAAKVGVVVPPLVWERSQKHFENTQCMDGGWAYMYYPQRVGRAGMPDSPAYGSMTAAGTASLIICGQRLHVGGGKAFVNGAYPSCGNYKQNKSIAGGIDWLGKKFSVTENPGRGMGGGYQLYYLYALERVGMISGLQVLGTHDWYREGAAELVSKQRGGGWGMGMGFGGSSNDTAFGLLFLAKGNRPVLFQKLRWPSEKNEWNRSLHDLENLSNFIGTKLGKAVTWATASLDQSLEELRMSPVLVITGHEFPKLSGPHKEKLRQFIESGGTVLCDACCGSAAYRQAFRAFAQEVFPDYPCRVLDSEHPVFHSYYEIDHTYGLEGIDVGCRTGLFFSPNALSCLLEMQDYEDAQGKWSLNAMKLCTNIGAYATGKEMLADRLAKVELPAERKAVDANAVTVERGAVRLARLVHEGDYNTDPRALSELAGLMRQKARVDVVPQAPHVRATDADLGKYPVVFMIGHHNFKLTPDEVKALRAYLDRGGFLLAEACCGKTAFDTSFRQLVQQVYPEQPMKELGDDHPIYRGAVGVPLGEVRYRKLLAEELKSAGTRHPPLEAVVVNGRTTILYSRYDYTCSLEGDKPYSCRGYVDEDGQRLALDLVLYAIGY